MKNEDSLEGENDTLVWSRDFDKHSYGEFSFAVVQANEVMEDQSQVETGQNATFVGAYDGHGGPEASKFICDHLFTYLLSEISSVYCWFLSLLLFVS
ncbi:protein phosphatase [Lithospermum erythrorhizon]|uniref:Protein phosphatase n=1 Tax=Lithospermum erythrorhizon TaxID=34254 RepID=A0AAV3NWF7_LITER